jgi:hypothetical protein
MYMEKLIIWLISFIHSITYSLVSSAMNYPSAGG